MNGNGFTETLNNPNPGELRLVMRLAARSFTIWQHSFNEGDEWKLANVYIGTTLQFVSCLLKIRCYLYNLERMHTLFDVMRNAFSLACFTNHVVFA